MEYVKCSDCPIEFKKSRLLTIYNEPVKDEDIICGQCIKKEHGDGVYNFYKNLIDSPLLSEKSEDNA